jgi:hypothetical protein
MFYRHDSQYSWYYSSPETFEVWEKTTQGRKKKLCGPETTFLQHFTVNDHSHLTMILSTVLAAMAAIAPQLLLGNVSIFRLSDFCAKGRGL